MENKNDMRELDLETMGGITGGARAVVDTGSDSKAAVRSDHFKGKNQIATLTNGTEVNTISDLVYDPESGRNWVQIEFTDSRGRQRTGWIAASIVGLKR